MSRNGPKSDRCHLDDESPNLSGIGLRCVLCNRPLSLQADGNVACEDVPVAVFGVCRPACHDSSLYIVVPVLFLDAVVLSQLHVALDIFYQHIVHVHWGVVYNELIARWLRVETEN